MALATANAGLSVCTLTIHKTSEKTIGIKNHAISAFCDDSNIQNHEL